MDLANMVILHDYKKILPENRAGLQIMKLSNF